MCMKNRLLSAILFFLFQGDAIASEVSQHLPATYLTSGWGIACVLTFIVALACVMLEGKLHIRKSIPVLISAGIVWLIVGYLGQKSVSEEFAKVAFSHAFLEYGELFLFLMVAMTYVNTLQERGLFEWIQYKLLSYGMTYNSIFWALGLGAFFLSPVLDNLTTALVMASVAIAVAGNNAQFVSKCCVSIVVASNAGGAFSPFGDITTLMVWNAGHVEALEFLSLFTPAFVSWFVPALCIAFSINSEKAPHGLTNEKSPLKSGAVRIIMLFVLTIIISVMGRQFFGLPSVMGMMLGLGLLKWYCHRLSRDEHTESMDASMPSFDEETYVAIQQYYRRKHKPFDVLVSIKRVEWDTLLFFYGVVMSVAGLGALGYLEMLSKYSYGTLGSTWASILVGMFSAVVDNIPVMFAVLQMSPDMTHNDWLLVTLTAGIGGSMISIGSAAGVALMDFAKITDPKTGMSTKAYTFAAHLKWTPVIFAGYICGVVVHLWTHGMPLPF